MQKECIQPKWNGTVLSPYQRIELVLSEDGIPKMGVDLNRKKVKGMVMISKMAITKPLDFESQ